MLGGDVIVRCTHSSISITFLSNAPTSRAQVGKDQRAQAFLGMLDNDPVVGKMVDATSYYELEADEYARKGVNLTPGARSPLNISPTLSLDTSCAHHSVHSDV